MTKQYITDGSPDGSVMGQSATEKISFFDATPVVQQTAITTVSTSNPYAITDGYGFATTAQMTALITGVNQAKTILDNLGLSA